MRKSNEQKEYINSCKKFNLDHSFRGNSPQQKSTAVPYLFIRGILTKTAPLHWQHASQRQSLCSPIVRAVGIAINKHRIRSSNMHNSPRGQYICSDQITDMPLFFATPRPRLLRLHSICEFGLQIFVTAACCHA